MKSLKFNLVCSYILFFTYAIHGQTNFSEENVILDQLSLINHSMADVNSDGFEDIVTMSRDKIVWYENDGAGNYNIPNEVSDIAYAGRSALYCLDYDNDGDMDIIFNYYTSPSNKIVIYDNDGLENFTENFIDCYLSYTLVLEIRFADMNNDGFLDFITYRGGDSSIGEVGGIYIYLNDGTNSYGDPISFLTTNDNYTSIEIADLDNDNDLDVVAVTDNGRVSQYENTGNGTLISETIISYNFDDIKNVEVKDFNGDGAEDIVVASYYDDKLSWFPNDGTGSFPQEIAILDTTRMEVLHTEDMDGDGDYDLLFGGSQVLEIDQYGWYENDGSGTFITEHILINNLDGVYDIFHLDVENDGDKDFITVSHSNKLYVHKNDGLDNLERSKNFTPNILAPNAVDAADIDGDGWNDVIVGTNFDHEIHWFRNDGQGNFGQSNIITEEAFGVKNIFSSDMDNDGDMDILSASNSYQGSRINWYENDGQGNFDTHILSTVYYFPNVIFAADLDNNGFKDIISSSSNGHILLFPNNGGGNFGTVDTIIISFQNPRALFSADVDNDGDNDIVLGSYNDDTIAWYANDGTGNFGNPNIISNNANGVNSIFVADMDEDNDLDIISSSEFDNKIAWYPNNGTGIFGSEIIISTIQDEPSAVFVEDLDDDNDMDLVVSSINDNQLLLYPNLGQGIFGPYEIISEELRGPSAIHIAQLTNDTRPDLISCSFFHGNHDGKLVWYRNDGVKSRINGKTFWDVNGNQEWDDTDVPLETFLELSPNDIQYIVNGNYSISLDTGQYFLSYMTNDEWTLHTDSSNYSVSILDSLTTISNLDFGFIPTDTTNALQAFITSGQTICDEEVSFFLSWKNIGNTIQSGVITLKLDNWTSIMDIDFLDNMADNIIGDSIIQWNFDSLFPNEIMNKEIKILMPGVNDGFVIGNSIQFLLDIEYTSINTPNPLIDHSTFDYNPIILCAYDPNDKLVNPDRDGIDNLTIFGEPLVYTIRFQNTGNYFASDVILRDTLDDNLDPSTLRILGSSHLNIMNTTLEQDRYLTFSFIDIMLPDSTLDFDGSQGYVNYMIEAYPGLPVSTTLENTASIYFDSNPAVVTNTTQNTLVNEIIINYSSLASCDSLLYNNQIFYETTYLGDTTFLYDGWIIENLDEIIINNSVTEEIFVEIQQGAFHTLPDGTEVSEVGIYETLLYTEDNCDSLIITNVQFITGIIEIENQAFEYILSPNPAKDKISIRIKENKEAVDFIITDALGRNIYENNLTTYTEIDVSNWTSGLYHLIFKDKKGSILSIDKFVKMDY